MDPRHAPIRSPFLRGTLAAFAAVALAALLAACSTAGGAAVGSDPAVNLIPDPTDASTSPFAEIDDAAAEIAFTRGFTFRFYGTTYSSIWLNTNGGATFGSGDADYDVAAAEVTAPGIAVFWGDMDAGEYDGPSRRNQFSYQQYDDRFVLRYRAFQDFDVEAWQNSATVSLYRDGRIVVQYSAVESQDILVGVFDGTHGDDRTVSVQSSYSDYATTGSGLLVFDAFAGGGLHSGQLNGRTIEYLP